MARNKLSYKAQLSRHDHDVSAGYAASLVPGAIVPQYFDILNPGDSIYYRLICLLVCRMLLLPLLVRLIFILIISLYLCRCFILLWSGVCSDE